jgi:hypothetical protein
MSCTLVDPEAGTPLAGEPSRADPPSPVDLPHRAPTSPAVTLGGLLMLCRAALNRFLPGFQPGVDVLFSYSFAIVCACVYVWTMLDDRE